MQGIGRTKEGSAFLEALRALWLCVMSCGRNVYAVSDGKTATGKALLK
jgi:hypothetical protein